MLRKPTWNPTDKILELRNKAQEDTAVAAAAEAAESKEGDLADRGDEAGVEPLSGELGLDFRTAAASEKVSTLVKTPVSVVGCWHGQFRGGTVSPEVCRGNVCVCASSTRSCSVDKSFPAGHKKNGIPKGGSAQDCEKCTVVTTAAKRA